MVVLLSQSSPQLDRNDNWVDELTAFAAKRRYLFCEYRTAGSCLQRRKERRLNPGTLCFRIKFAPSMRST
jgi:hypothetical protein